MTSRTASDKDSVTKEKGRKEEGWRESKDREKE